MAQRGTLYQQLMQNNRGNGQQMQQQQMTPNNNKATRQILNEAASKGFGLNVNDFVKFANMMRGHDVGGILQELVDSGQMSKQQYETLKQKASNAINIGRMLFGGKK